MRVTASQTTETPLFARQFVQASVQGNVKAPYYWPSVIPRSLLDSHHKEPVMQQVFNASSREIRDF